MKLDAEYIIKKLALKPHPEGGYYREIYRSEEKINSHALPKRYGGDRNFSTSIYYLLKEGEYSKLHRLKSDEIYHFYLGASVEIILIYPNGKIETRILGNNLERGESLQIIVPKNVWQGLRLIGNGRFSLMGTTVSPGFDYNDFELGDEEKLQKIIKINKKIREFL